LVLASNQKEKSSNAKGYFGTGSVARSRNNGLNMQYQTTSGAVHSQNLTRNTNQNAFKGSYAQVFPPRLLLPTPLRQQSLLSSVNYNT
jgi:hypothetical protein